MGTEVGYLEQSGTFSLKEPAMGKWLLYFNFDRLLTGSPERLALVATETHPLEAKLVEFDFFFLFTLKCPQLLSVIRLYS